MKPDYRNWMPNGMLCGFGFAFLGLLILFLVSLSLNFAPALKIIFGVAALVFLGVFLWCLYLHQAFSYTGKRQMSRQIIDGISKYVKAPGGGTILDVGCGSGALTIASARRNPKAKVTGLDRWGKEYASYNKPLCENNARLEGVKNTTFMQGDATKLPFPDASFDAVTSNYVYHNISGHNKQDLLRETLRVLKKGGTFAIHDIMSKSRYGDMDEFVRELKAEGYEDVHLKDTTDGTFMSKTEAITMDLAGSKLLYGKK